MSENTERKMANTNKLITQRWN